MRNHGKEGRSLGSAMELSAFETMIDEALARVEGGEALVIERDGQPIVRLVPAPQVGADQP